MRFVIYLMIFAFFQTASSTEVILINGHRQYEFTISQEQIAYKDELTSLSLIKKKCNAHILERMNKRFDKLFARPFLTDSRPEFLKVKINGKQFYEPRYGYRAVFLQTLPKEIKNLKIEESFNCPH